MGLERCLPLALLRPAFLLSAFLAGFFAASSVHAQESYLTFGQRGLGISAAYATATGTSGRTAVLSYAKGQINYGLLVGSVSRDAGTDRTPRQDAFTIAPTVSALMQRQADGALFNIETVGAYQFSRVEVFGDEYNADGNVSAHAVTFGAALSRNLTTGSLVAVIPEAGVSLTPIVVVAGEPVGSTSVVGTVGLGLGMPLTSWGLLVLKPSIGIGADAMAFSFSLGLLRL